MTNVTNILANESGIQYQGVDDASSSTGIYPIIGLITGTFKRGRYDKPMVITRENMRGCLGYDPKNPSYIAVQDALSSGVPSVQVLRLVNTGGGDTGGAMIVSGWYTGGMGYIYSRTPLTIKALNGNVNITHQYGDIGSVYGDSNLYMVGVDDPLVALSITPEDGVSPIDGFGMQYITNIDEWWSGGYTRFEGMMGMYLENVPLYAPKNTTDFSFMFLGCGYFKTDISNWDMSKATNISSMLSMNTSQRSDLSKWCVPLISPTSEGISSFVFGCDYYEDNPDKLPVWGTCPNG